MLPPKSTLSVDTKYPSKLLFTFYTGPKTIKQKLCSLEETGDGGILILHISLSLGSQKRKEGNFGPHAHL